LLFTLVAPTLTSRSYSLLTHPSPILLSTP
jgi:hypothetical protein